MGKKILLVDDSATIRRTAQIFLQEIGCEVIALEDGFQALAKMETHRPDLVLLDVLMPRLGGLEACALIKRNARFAQTPVVMLSSKDGIFDVARGRLAGACDYLPKPFTKAALQEVVARHLGTQLEAQR